MATAQALETVEEKEIKKDLLKYYNKVSKCIRCGVFYGMDNGVAENGFCPKCNNPKRFRRRELNKEDKIYEVTI